MSKIISQNDLDAKQISDSVKNFFDRFHVSQLLKTSNIKKEKGESPVKIMMYAFSLVFRNRSMYMDMLLGNDDVSFSKDTYYRFMNSVHTNWIRFTALLPADYVLFDSWFASPKTLTAVKALGYDVIAMIKRTDKMTFNCDGSKLSLKEIYRMNKKRRGRSKYLLSVTVEVEKDGQVIPAKVVYVRNRSNRKDYLCLISTNIEIDEEEIIRIYSKRWQIEVFFKVCKSYLKLASECRSLSYDAMTAHIAVVFMRYMMLAVENRESEDPRTLGELFMYFMDEMADITFLQAFNQIMTLFSKMMVEKFDLDEEEISKMIDAFIAALTPSMQRQLKAA